MSIKDLENKILESKKLLLVKINADWCIACRTMYNSMMEVIPHFDEVELVQIDIEKVPEIMKKFNVNTIPTVIFIRNGQILYRLSGEVKPVVFENTLHTLLNVV